MGIEKEGREVCGRIRKCREAPYSSVTRGLCNSTVPQIMCGVKFPSAQSGPVVQSHIPGISLVFWRERNKEGGGRAIGNPRRTICLSETQRPFRHQARQSPEKALCAMITESLKDALGDQCAFKRLTSKCDFYRRGRVGSL